MRSRQLALCAAVAACAVTTAPAYGADARGTGTTTGLVRAMVQADGAGPAGPAPGAARRAGALRSTGGTAGWAAAWAAAPFRSGSAAVQAARSARLEPAAMTAPAGPRAAADATRASRGRPAAPANRAAKGTADTHAAPSGELSSTSAVGLVLAGGVVLVIAGQLLRLRLRLRRERRGEADER
ncbi:hypothetical protein [Streptomyces sp. NPDC048612]|uniref:hypothetical protein n=1 Tax=Streptomyces sp. NPDC048612 TaxID=3365579 RepID=UPI00371A7C9A